MHAHHTKLLIGLLLVTTVGNAEAAPPWCSGLDQPQYTGKVSSALTSKDPRDALPDLVSLTCWPDDEAQKRMKEIDGARARWSAAMMLTEADWADVAAWSMSPQSARNDSDIALDPNKKIAPSALGPLDQFAAITGSYADYTYLADALGPRLTEAGRLAYIRQACLRDNVDASVVEWAACNPDLALLDKKKLANEIRADRTRGGHDKMIVRIQAFFLDGKVKEMTAKWNDAKAKDPAYTKMFDIARKTRSEWDQLWKTEAAALELMLAMDDVRATSSRKLREGCEAKVWPAVKAAISLVEAKRFAGISTDIADSWLAPALGSVANSPRGWLALAAYHTCHHDDKTDALSSTIGYVLQFLPGYRGPRLAAQTAIMNAGLQLDDASAKIDYPSIDHRGRFEGSAERGYYATVAKVTVKGDKATVAFKPKLEKIESCTSRKETNRISMITSSGHVIYESTCTAWKPVVVNAAPPAQAVDARYVDGLKPGMNVVVGSGMVMAGFAPGKNVPSLVAGAPVK